MAKNFKDLIVWQRSFSLATDIYKTTKSFPKSEIYGLTQQIRRCSVSIPSNIAEGFNRYHNKEYKQFLYIALGSCAELETQIRIAHELGYIKDPDVLRILDVIDYIARMISNLNKKLWTRY